MDSEAGPERREGQDSELSRRDFVRGAAATGLFVVGAGYAKPALKLAGVTRLSAATSNPPRRRPPGDTSDDDGDSGNHNGDSGNHNGDSGNHNVQSGGQQGH